MAAHRYWRIRFHSTDSNTVDIADIELRDSVSGPDRTGSGTPSASTGTPANAFDGNAATYWSAGGITPGAYTVYIQYDFGMGSSFDIVEAQFTHPNGQSVNNAAEGIRVEYSDDASTWTVQTHVAHSKRPTGDGDTYLFDFTESLNGKLTKAANRKDNSYATTFGAVLKKEVRVATVARSGTKTLSGVTQVNGVGTSRRVFVIHQPTFTMVRDAFSNDDGTFEFTGLDEGPYMVIGFDGEGNNNAEIFSHVTAVDPP